MLRVSSFFQASDRQVQGGILLISIAVLDRFHYKILGRHNVNRKASLLDVMDPYTSVVSICMNRFLHLLEDWSPTSSWRLLWWLGAANLQDKHLMLRARDVVLSLNLSYAERIDKRVCAWPMPLMWLISEHCSEQEKLYIVKLFLDHRCTCDCCIGMLGVQIRRKYSTVDRMMSEELKTILCMWNLLHKWTSAPVECEHKAVKEDVDSLTTGASRTFTSFRSICRHLHHAHQQMGGKTAALPLR